ncbi:hypothetical protein [Metasolibacillus meyeri]|uniref:hypothetical protein n=1 Tax=Metasolibacillus meyeri TaxID=1071052 RepID=UPI000D3182BF|nr:hypothetical protein [Metasolibacillus meyeri]
MKNVAKKQSDSKTIVLTTAVQEGGKEYVVSLNGKEIGKFTGVSAVIPTAVDVVEKSKQGILGEQITVQAKVTVADGQSKAGIPVTFNIVTTQYNINPGGSLNAPIVTEVTTDENGVATYTYTRYASTAQQLATSDEVQAYATGKPSARSFGKVYWAAIQPLAITEVTEGNAVNNGAKKVYKVKAALEHAEAIYNGSTLTGYKVNVGFKENVNVTPDKAVKTVVVTDANGRNLGYPGQYTTSTVGNNSADKAIEILLDAKGEATFTLTGSNATVTPFVFVDQKVNPSNAAGTIARFDETELVAYAPELSFGKIQNLGLNLTSNGTQNAAAYRTTAPHASNIATYATGQVLTSGEFAAANQNSGGRSYTAVLTDVKIGALAPSNTVVKVSLAIGTALSANNDNAIVYLVDENAKKVYKVKDGQIIDLYTDAKGQVAFKLVGAKDSYATPTVFSDTGDTVNRLDKNDLQQAGEIAYFGDVKVETAKLTVDNKDVQTANVTDKAVFKYQTVDQNGFAYYSHDFVATFQVDATFSSAKVTYLDVNGVTRTETVQHGGSSTRSFTVKAVNGVAQIEVEAVRGTRVDVSANAHNLPNLHASATFQSVANDGIAAGAVITGRVIAVDKVSKRILLTNSSGQTYELSYAGADLVTVATPNSIDTFEATLTVRDEIQFTNAKEGTTSKFINYNNNDGTLAATISEPNSSAIDIKNKTVSIVIKQDLAKYDSATSEAKKGYDFGGETIGSATHPAVINVTGNNTIIKNAIIYGDITVDVANDISFENVTHHGNIIVKHTDGDTINVTNSSLDVVKLETKEHINLVGSSIKEVVVATSNEIKVTADATSSVAGYTVVPGIATTNIKQNGVVQTPVVEVPFTSVVTTTTTTGDTISFTFSPAVTESVTLTVAGTVATLDVATASDTSKKFTFVPTNNAALVLKIGSKEYTATYSGLGTVTFTRKY